MNEFFTLAIGLGVVAIFFVVPLILLIRVSGLCRGMEDLQRRLIRMEGRMAKEPGKPAPPAASVPAVAASAAEADVKPAPAPQPPSAPPQPRAEPERLAVPETQPARTATAAPSEPNAVERAVAQAWNWFTIGEAYRKPGESWEYAAATHWLLRAGILIVLAGVAFFLKYSIERGLMGPLGRVALSLAAGVALIVSGLRLLFKKYHLLGQGLAGTGFVTLYFAFYAASILYHLMPLPAAFGLMACVTAAAGTLAVLYQSLGIALLGVVGGYATPLMLGGSSANPLFFYAYVLALGVGVLGISWARRWPVLNGLGMLAAYGLSFLFCSRHAAADDLFRDLLFTSGVHLLYLLSVIVLHLRTQRKTGAFEWTALSLNAATYWTWAFLLFKPVYGREGAGLVALAVATVYVALAYACIRRAVLDRAALTLFVAFAAVFLAMSPVFMLTSHWLTFAWCLQALAMLWIAQRAGQPFLAKAAVALFALACARGLFFDLNRFYHALRPWRLAGTAFWRAAGLRALLCGVLPVTLTAAWRLARGYRHAAKVTGLVLLQVWLLLTLEAGLLARVFAPGFRGGAVTLVWTLFAFALLFAGIRLRGSWLRWCGLALFALAVTKLLASDLDGLATLYRIIAFLSTGVLLVLGSFVYLTYKNLFETGERAVPDKREVP
ncbi:MAG: DUF2339 domain-containing protein [Kiritimatiellia bacterium]|jgi:uncharacterized membrane protein|nr:DUF2339 domain-containing protein [Kiritimatiellia bacterium]